MARGQVDPGAPPPPAQTNIRHPIGVPDDYIAHYTRPPDVTGTNMNPQQAALAREFAPGSFGTSQQGTQSQAVPPRYFDGDEYAPAGLSPDEIAKLQKYMMAVGLMKKGDAQLGVWDGASVKAYAMLLSEANASGTDMAQALKNRAKQRAQYGAQDAQVNQRAPLQIQLTPRADLDSVFRGAVMDKLGQGWTTEQINHAIDAYQLTEAAAQQRNYATQPVQNADGSYSGGGQFEQAPSAQSFIEQEIRKNHPDELMQYNLIKHGGPVDAFQQALSQWNNQ